MADRLQLPKMIAVSNKTNSFCILRNAFPAPSFVTNQFSICNAVVVFPCPPPPPPLPAHTHLFAFLVSFPWNIFPSIVPPPPPPTHPLIFRCYRLSLLDAGCLSSRSIWLITCVRYTIVLENGRCFHFDLPLLTVYHIKWLSNQSYSAPLPLREEKCAFSFVSITFGTCFPLTLTACFAFRLCSPISTPPPPLSSPTTFPCA